MNHLIWNDLVLNAKISALLAKPLLKGFDETWGAGRNVLCSRDILRITWNWKCHFG
jgi:hypothetical protein